MADFFVIINLKQELGGAKLLRYLGYLEFTHK